MTNSVDGGFPSRLVIPLRPNRANLNLYWHSITLASSTLLILKRELNNYDCKHNETGGNFRPWWP